MSIKTMILMCLLVSTSKACIVDHDMLSERLHEEISSLHLPIGDSCGQMEQEVQQGRIWRDLGWGSGRVCVSLEEDGVLGVDTLPNSCVYVLLDLDIIFWYYVCNLFSNIWILVTGCIIVDFIMFYFYYN